MPDAATAPTPTERRDAFWAPFVLPGTVYEAAPDDGHAHDFHPISPKSLGSFGPTGTACLKCGWFIAWGDPRG
jgi:hypothetical protein